MTMLISRATVSLFACTAVAVAVVGCKTSDKGTADTSAAGAGEVAPASANATTLVRGTVTSDSGNVLTLTSDSGVVTVKMGQPFKVYSRVSGSMSDVKPSSFIGVTTVKQPDGSERATEIHVFPEELRGVGEGSRMMTPDTAGNANRMTNGTATPAASRMSNGSVASTTGSSLVVQYAGGSQTVTVPAGTPVTVFTLSSNPLAMGDQIAVMATKDANGSLTSDKAISMKK
jgi:hypothetical protein